LTSPLFVAARTDLASVKNSVVNRVISCGLASTSFTRLRVWDSICGTQPASSGSAVAMVTSVRPTRMGRQRRASA